MTASDPSSRIELAARMAAALIAADYNVAPYPDTLADRAWEYVEALEAEQARRTAPPLAAPGSYTDACTLCGTTGDRDEWDARVLHPIWGVVHIVCAATQRLALQEKRRASAPPAVVLPLPPRRCEGP